MAANRKAINFGKIKRYIKNRTAEFYIGTLYGKEKTAFKSKIHYINNVQRTKDLLPAYDEAEIESIKKLLTDFSPTREQKCAINSINRQTKEDNAKQRDARINKSAAMEELNDDQPDEDVSIALDRLIGMIENTGVNLAPHDQEKIKYDESIRTLFRKIKIN